MQTEDSKTPETHQASTPPTADNLKRLAGDLGIEAIDDPTWAKLAMYCQVAWDWNTPLRNSSSNAICSIATNLANSFNPTKKSSISVPGAAFQGSFWPSSAQT